MHETTAYIGIGTNTGDRLHNIKQALKELKAHVSPFIRVSPIYETEPRFDCEQDVFFNAVVALETDLEPPTLLQHLLAIELRMGRLRQISRPKGPRLIDLDLLALGSRVVESEVLTLPHPGIQERRFVLCPWADLEPTWKHPVVGQTIAQMLAKTHDEGWVKVFRDNARSMEP